MDSQVVVQTFGPVGTEEFGDGRKASVALEQKCRLEGGHRMGQLQEQLGSLAVTSADVYDPARAIQVMRRIFAELDALGDKVVHARKVHTFLQALPDRHYAHFKAVLAAERRDDGAEMDFDDLARPTTSFHALQIRGKVDTNDDDSGSNSRALNTAVHGGHPNFANRADVDATADEMVAGTRMGTTTRRTATTAAVEPTRTRTHLEEEAAEARKVLAGEVAETKYSGTRQPRDLLTVIRCHEAATRSPRS